MLHGKQNGPPASYLGASHPTHLACQPRHGDKDTAGPTKPWRRITTRAAIIRRENEREQTEARDC